MSNVCRVRYETISEFTAMNLSNIGMKYQLVIQFPANSVKDFETMIKIEEILEQKPGDHSEVDGHDAGAGEMNIFIHTNDPLEAFKQSMESLGGQDIRLNVPVAYREILQKEYKVLWPEELKVFKLA